MESRGDVIAEHGDVMCCTVARIILERECVNVTYGALHNSGKKDIDYRGDANADYCQNMQGNVRQVICNHHGWQ